MCGAVLGKNHCRPTGFRRPFHRSLLIVVRRSAVDHSKRPIPIVVCLLFIYNIFLSTAYRLADSTFCSVAVLSQRAVLV